ncbi:hypothetical protein [Microbacterium testaceum]|nr:hypothetical protein [Microbacterium testaceum]WJS92715.1 hypothetical protein NYQ11_12580 [Microbacterium testaceum]
MTRALPRAARGVKAERRAAVQALSGGMPALAIILVIVGLVLLFLGIFVEAVKFLLWIGVIILIIGIIAALLRFIRRQV